MFAVHHFRVEPFGSLEPVRMWQTGHRQAIFQRRFVEPGQAVHALKAGIAARHHQTAAGMHPLTQELEPVDAGEPLPRLGRHEQRERADIRQDDR